MDFEDFLGFGGVLLILFLFLFVAPVVANQFEARAEIAEGEQLRIDAASTDPSQAEDVIGQVTAFNQKLAKKKRTNKWFLIELYVPDIWETVEPIPVPKAK